MYALKFVASLCDAIQQHLIVVTAGGVDGGGGGGGSRSTTTAASAVTEPCSGLLRALKLICHWI